MASRMTMVAWLVAALVAPTHAQDLDPARQEVLSDRVVDHGYLFELVAPDRDWRPLGEVEARRLVPEATAALMHLDSAVPVVVVVRPRGTIDARIAAELRAEACMYADQVVRVEETEVCGRPAVAYEVEGGAGACRMRFAGVAFEFPDYIYELLSFGTADQTAGEGYARWDTFRLLPGVIVVDRLPTTPDGRGPDWRVRAGRLELPACGVRVDVGAAGLTLFAGEAARTIQWAPPCEAVLMDAAGDVGLAFSPAYPLGSTIEQRYARSVEHVTRDGTTMVVGSWAAAIGGGHATLIRFANPDGGGLIHAVLGAADGKARCALSAWWYRDQDAERAAAIVEQTLAATTLLDDAACAALWSELAQGSNPDARVLREAAYRGGLLRSFEHDLTFARPRGPWRLRFEDSPVPGTELICAEAPALGLTATVTVYRMRGYDSATFHTWAVDSTVGKPRDLPAAHRARSAPFLISWLDHDLETWWPWHRMVATTVAGDRLVKIVVEGETPHLVASSRAAKDVLDGLTLIDDDLRGLEATDDLVRDGRLGFLVRRPGPGWRFSTDRSQTTLGPLAGGVTVSHGDGGVHRLVVVAIGAGWGGTAAASSGSARTPCGPPPPFAAEHLLRTSLGPSRTELVEVGEETLGGAPCDHLRARLPRGGAVDAYVLQREGVTLVVAIFDEDGHGPQLDELKQCVELLD